MNLPLDGSHPSGNGAHVSAGDRGRRGCGEGIELSTATTSATRSRTGSSSSAAAGLPSTPRPGHVVPIGQINNGNNGSTNNISNCYQHQHQHQHRQFRATNPSDRDRATAGTQHQQQPELSSSPPLPQFSPPPRLHIQSPQQSRISRSGSSSERGLVVAIRQQQQQQRGDRQHSAGVRAPTLTSSAEEDDGYYIVRENDDSEEDGDDDDDVGNSSLNSSFTDTAAERTSAMTPHRASTATARGSGGAHSTCSVPTGGAQASTSLRPLPSFKGSGSTDNQAAMAADEDDYYELDDVEDYDEEDEELAAQRYMDEGAAHSRPMSTTTTSAARAASTTEVGRGSRSGSPTSGIVVIASSHGGSLSSPPYNARGPQPSPFLQQQRQKAQPIMQSPSTGSSTHSSLRRQQQQQQQGHRGSLEEASYLPISPPYSSHAYQNQYQYHVHPQGASPAVPVTRAPPSSSSDCFTAAAAAGRGLVSPTAGGPAPIAVPRLPIPQAPAAQQQQQQCAAHSAAASGVVISPRRTQQAHPHQQRQQQYQHQQLSSQPPVLQPHAAAAPPYSGSTATASPSAMSRAQHPHPPLPLSSVLAGEKSASPQSSSTGAGGAATMSRSTSSPYSQQLPQKHQQQFSSSPSSPTYVHQPSAAACQSLSLHDAFFLNESRTAWLVDDLVLAKCLSFVRLMGYRHPLLKRDKACGRDSIWSSTAAIPSPLTRTVPAEREGQPDTKTDRILPTFRLKRRPPTCAAARQRVSSLFLSYDEAMRWISEQEYVIGTILMCCAHASPTRRSTCSSVASAAPSPTATATGSGTAVVKKKKGGARLEDSGVLKPLHSMSSCTATGTAPEERPVIPPSMHPIHWAAQHILTTCPHWGDFDSFAKVWESQVRLTLYTASPSHQCVFHSRDDDLTFSSDFDGGNLHRVERAVEPYVYYIWLEPDNGSDKRIWFSFAVTGAREGRTLRIRLLNSAPHTKLYRENGMSPVFRDGNTVPHWTPVDQCSFRTMNNEEDGEVTFSISVRSSHDTLQIAFCAPYTYSDLLCYFCHWHALVRVSLSGLRFEERVLCRTPDGRKQHLIIITSPTSNIKARSKKEKDHHSRSGAGGAAAAALVSPGSPVSATTNSGGGGGSGTRRKRATPPTTNSNGNINEKGSGGGSKHDGSGSGGGDVVRGPYSNFSSGKKVILISARVHPGEVTASHAAHGLISFLLSADTRAVQLREHFLFFIVPMLNPDGVGRGHSRLDQYGSNLNRCYKAPDPETQPTVFSLRKVFEHLQKTFRERFIMYLDFHSHASQSSGFMFGNHLPASVHHWNLVYPKIVELHARESFSFGLCRFGQVHMFTKDGASRVLFGESLIHSYTVELPHFTDRVLYGDTFIALNNGGAVVHDPAAMAGPGPFHGFSPFVFAEDAAAASTGGGVEGTGWQLGRGVFSPSKPAQPRGRSSSKAKQSKTTTISSGAGAGAGGENTSSSNKNRSRSETTNARPAKKAPHGNGTTSTGGGAHNNNNNSNNNNNGRAIRRGFSVNAADHRQDCVSNNTTNSNGNSYFNSLATPTSSGAAGVGGGSLPGTGGVNGSTSNIHNSTSTSTWGNGSLAEAGGGGGSASLSRKAYQNLVQLSNSHSVALQPLFMPSVLTQSAGVGRACAFALLDYCAAGTRFSGELTTYGGMERVLLEVKRAIRLQARSRKHKARRSATRPTSTQSPMTYQQLQMQLQQPTQPALVGTAARDAFAAEPIFRQY